MALFHLSVTQTKRSAGQSAIASAAYRAGERLYSEYYGEYSDYTRKGGVICSDILLPSHAPPEYADRQTLWNAVEKAERGKNAQLAYSFDIALGVWVRNQKQTYANGTLQPEKAERLESIGILWEQSNFDFKWNEAYEAAKLYFEENGSLNVPIGYTTPDGIALGKWVARQQYAYKSPNNSNCKLTPTRVTLLEKIGMQWEKTDPWQHKYNLALDYLQMHGNLQIPAKYKTADGIWLGRWLYDQKVLLRKQSPRLSAEQTNKLRKLLDEGTAGKAC